MKTVIAFVVGRGLRMVMIVGYGCGSKGSI